MEVDGGAWRNALPQDLAPVGPASGPGPYDAAARSDTSLVGIAPLPATTGKRISVVMLVLGIALLWPMPLGGVVLLVAACVALAISTEAEMGQGP